MLTEKPWIWVRPEASRLRSDQCQGCDGFVSVAIFKVAVSTPFDPPIAWLICQLPGFPFTLLCVSDNSMFSLFLHAFSCVNDIEMLPCAALQVSSWTDVGLKATSVQRYYQPAVLRNGLFILCSLLLLQAFPFNYRLYQKQGISLWAVVI